MFQLTTLQGDSGGPAVYTDSNSGITYQVGIISWGNECGKYPGVYTNLESPAIMKFINKVMCEIIVPENCINGYFYGNQNIKDDATGTNNESSDSMKIGFSKIETNNVTEVAATDVKINETNAYGSPESDTSKAIFLKPSNMLAIVMLMVIVTTK